VDSLFAFLHLAEQLKNETRHSWTSKRRHESVAEHTWRTSLMAYVLAPHLSFSVDLCKTLKMVIIHDIVEALACDVPVFATGPETEKKEREAILAIRKMLNSAVGDEIFMLWHEFEQSESSEAKFAKALDKMEANLQHNEAEIETWTKDDLDQVFKIDHFCLIDPYLQKMNEKIKSEAILKWKGKSKNSIQE
jgi:putative hydrolases of HD superfamily